MQCIFDSSIWIAYFFVSDSQHEAALSLFQKISIEEETVIAVPEYIILEVYTKLNLLKDRALALRFLDLLDDHPHRFPVLYFSSTLSANLYQFVRKNGSGKLSYVDMALLYFSKEYKIVTFDRQLEKLLYAEGAV